MPTLTMQFSGIDELSRVAERVLSFTAGNKVFAFYAPMGAGKTTLIKEICRHLGSHDHFSSPTYSIVNEYVNETTGAKIYHLDLYRIKDIEEALAAGVEEYLDSGNYCFIEWAELIEPLLPANAVKINIEMQDGIRNLTIFTD